MLKNHKLGHHKSGAIWYSGAWIYTRRALWLFHFFTFSSSWSSFDIVPGCWCDPPWEFRWHFSASFRTQELQIPLGKPLVVPVSSWFQGWASFASSPLLPVPRLTSSDLEQGGRLPQHCCSSAVSGEGFRPQASTQSGLQPFPVTDSGRILTAINF